MNKESRLLREGIAEQVYLWMYGKSEIIVSYNGLPEKIKARFRVVADSILALIPDTKSVKANNKEWVEWLEQFSLIDLADTTKYKSFRMNWDDWQALKRGIDEK